jgi:putative transcriptional regulator
MNTPHPLITKLKTIRTQLGLHQQDVAEAGGLNRTTIGAIETGKRNPSLEILTKYCHGLGYEVDIKPTKEQP